MTALVSLRSFHVALAVKKLRAKLGMTLPELARHVGVSIPVINRLATEKPPHVRAKRLKRLARLLRMKLRDLHGSSGTVHLPEMYPAVQRPERREDCLTVRQKVRLQILYNERVVPVTDGSNCVRPCPFVSCKWHTFADVVSDTGYLKLNFPHLDPEEMARMTPEQLRAFLASLTDKERAAWVKANPGQIVQSCALDIADDVCSDGQNLTLEEVGACINVTRERVRQIEHRAISKLSVRIREDGSEQWRD